MKKDEAPGNSTRPTRRRSQTGLGNIDSTILISVGVPAAAYRRRLTASIVAATCEQLGDHVTTRNVRRVLGGSLRDIGPLVQQWRDSRIGTIGTEAKDRIQSIGAILICAIQEQTEVLIQADARAQEALLNRVTEYLKQLTTKTTAEESDRQICCEPIFAALEAMRHDLCGVQIDVNRLLEKATEPTSSLAAVMDIRVEKVMQSANNLELLAAEISQQLAELVGRIEAIADERANIRDPNT